jgi:hypothetical protein
MALSVVGAVREKYEAIAGVPTLFMFDAPVSADSAPVYPSYTVLTDEGMRTDYELELTVLEVTTLSLMVYANTLEDVDTAVERIKYNGGGISDGRGLDFCALNLDFDFQNMQVQRTVEQRFLAQTTGKTAQRIFGCRLEYRVSLYRHTA